MLKTLKKNWVLISLVFLLIALGMLFIYSASSYSSGIKYDDSFYFVKKQLLGFGMGLVVMLFFTEDSTGMYLPESFLVSTNQNKILQQKKYRVLDFSCEFSR